MNLAHDIDTIRAALFRMRAAVNAGSESFDAACRAIAATDRMLRTPYECEVCSSPGARPVYSRGSAAASVEAHTPAIRTGRLRACPIDPHTIARWRDGLSFDQYLEPSSEDRETRQAIAWLLEHAGAEVEP